MILSMKVYTAVNDGDSWYENTAAALERFAKALRERDSTVMSSRGEHHTMQPMTSLIWEKT